MATKQTGKAAPAKKPVKTQKQEGQTLSDEVRDKAEACGISGFETEEELREKLIQILAKNDVQGVEEDDTLALLDYVEAFPAKEEESQAPPTKKSGNSKTKQVEQETEEAADSEEEEEEEEEEEAEKPKASGKTGKNKEAEALVKEVKAKGLTTTPAKPTKVSKAKNKSTRAKKLLGEKWANLNDKQKEKAVAPLRKLLPEKQYRIQFLQDSFTVKFIGKSNEHNIFKYHLLRLLEDGKLEGIFVTHKFKETSDFAKFLPDDLEGKKLLPGAACSVIHPFHIDDVITLLKDTDFLKESVELTIKQDNRMVANRKKLESQLNTGDDKPKKKATAKKQEEAEEEEEVAEEVEELEEESVEEEAAEEEEEDEAPVVKTPAKKKTVIVTTKAAPVAKKPAEAAAPAKKVPAKKK